MHIKFVGNSKNISQISDQDFFKSVVNSLQRWKYASGQVLNFDFWGGSIDSIYPANSELNGISSIYFASHGEAQRSPLHLSPNVLGLTQVWYDTHTGEIMETDIVLNDLDFDFTLNPKDTSGYGSSYGNQFSGIKSKVFVENVITHELGHAFGLSHSGGLQSTMLFMESPEQAYLGCDELTAVHAIYPFAEDSSLRGSLEGKVKNDKGQPVFGAHVLAVSQKRGTVLATALTDQNGNYLISALEPGDYFIMVEPFFAGASTLPSYFSGIKSEICEENKLFNRNFLLSDSTNHLKKITVKGNEAGLSTLAPDVIVFCSPQLGTFAWPVESHSSIENAPSLFSKDSPSPSESFGWVDRLSLDPSESPRNNTRFYQLGNLEGSLNIHVLSYTLYSPLHSSLSLVNSLGEPLSTGIEIQDQVYEGSSGFINYDTSLKASKLEKGNYYLKLNFYPLESHLYPAGPVSIDSSPFILITGSLNDSAPALKNSIPDNPRCRLDESQFSNYVSPPDGPPPIQVQSQNRKSDFGIGFCARIKNNSTPSPPSSNQAILSWFLPWMFIFLTLLYYKCLNLASQPAGR